MYHREVCCSWIPIITTEGVIGVVHVGEYVDGQLTPYFITQTELGKLRWLMTLSSKNLCCILSVLPILFCN